MVSPNRLHYDVRHPDPLLHHSADMSAELLSFVPGCDVQAAALHVANGRRGLWEGEEPGWHAPSFEEEGRQDRYDGRGWRRGRRQG